MSVVRNTGTEEGRLFWESAERIAAQTKDWPASKFAGINESTTRATPPKPRPEPHVDLTVEEVVYWLGVVYSSASIATPGVRPVIERDRANCLKLGMAYACAARSFRSDGFHDWEREAIVAAWLCRQACLAIDRERAR